MKNKVKVAVLMGGKTPEHEISLISGREVVKNLDKEKYEVTPLIISKDGKTWKTVGSKKLLKLPDPLKLVNTDKNLLQSNYGSGFSLNKFVENVFDVVFIAMHGPFGEDGSVQGMLEFLGVKYTGPGVTASSVGMDKIMFKKIMKEIEVNIPKYQVVEKKQVGDLDKEFMEPPYIVKPYNQGSSVGMSLVKKSSNLMSAVDHALMYSDKVIVEEYIKGIEVTCAVIGNDKLIALPIVEIEPRKGEFFNYESKYFEGGAEEIVPARIDPELAKYIQKQAIKIYKTLDCSGFSRVDFILKNNKEPVVLEINTIPGLTPMSLFPKAAKAAGISYKKLLDKLINYALG